MLKIQREGEKGKINHWTPLQTSQLKQVCNPKSYSI